MACLSPTSPGTVSALLAHASQDGETAWREAAAAHWADGRRESAIDVLSLALSQRPDDIGLRRQLAERQLAVHRYAAALQTARPGGDALQPLTAEALFLLDRFEEALPLLDPSDPTQGMARVEALEILGRADEARTALDGMSEVPGADKTRIRLVRGRLHAAAGRYADAAAAYQDVLAKAPHDPGALFGLGQAWVRLGRREEGLDLLARHRELVPLLDRLDFALRAVDLAPSHGPSRALVGDAERAIGRIDRAQAAYEHAARLATPEQLAPIALRLARLLEDDRGQPDAALAILDGATLKTGGASPDVRLIVRAGDLLLRAGRPAEAGDRYERALALRPGDAAIVQRLSTARAESAPTTSEEVR